MPCGLASRLERDLGYRGMRRGLMVLGGKKEDEDEEDDEEEEDEEEEGDVVSWRGMVVRGGW